MNFLNCVMVEAKLTPSDVVFIMCTERTWDNYILKQWGSTPLKWSTYSDFLLKSTIHEERISNSTIYKSDLSHIIKINSIKLCLSHPLKYMMKIAPYLWHIHTIRCYLTLNLRKFWQMLQYEWSLRTLC